MKKIIGLFRLLRFELPLAAGICVVLGQLFAFGKFPSLFLTAAGFFSVFLISASILVLNDYFDVETDKINAPDRPIPSNQVSPSEALVFSLLLLGLGIFLSYLISIPVLIISIILSLVGFLYNRFFKKKGLLGNLMVSFSVGMTFIYGGATVGLPFNKVVLFFALIAALVDLGEEIAADSIDIKGDLLINSKSLAIKYGESAALKISCSILLLVVLISIVPFVLKWFPMIYLIPIGIMDIFIFYFSIKLLKSGNDKRRSYIRAIYLGATCGLFLFLILRLLEI
ncbi:UbiA family prenyltransferase [Bacteroidota bacterium]